jgi:hypothetical protein
MNFLIYLNFLISQYGPNQNKADQEFDDYLANLEDEHEPHVQEPPPVQEIVGEVYLLIISLLLYI